MIVGIQKSVRSREYIDFMLEQQLNRIAPIDRDILNLPAFLSSNMIQEIGHEAFCLLFISVEPDRRGIL